MAVRNMALWSLNMYLGIFLFILGIVSSPSLTQVCSGFPVHCYVRFKRALSQLLEFESVTERVPWPMPTCVMALPETDPASEVMYVSPIIWCSLFTHVA